MQINCGLISRYNSRADFHHAPGLSVGGFVFGSVASLKIFVATTIEPDHHKDYRHDQPYVIPAERFHIAILGPKVAKLRNGAI